MTTALTAQLATALTQFTSTTRLYALSVDGGGGSPGADRLLVEAFTADDRLDDIGVRDVIVLSTSVQVDLRRLLGQRASLHISLADRTRASFAGEISEVALLGSDGGFARYRVRIAPWSWRLGQVRNCRVWEGKTVVQIVDAVFEAYLPGARWRWSAGTSSFLADVRPRSYCCQYRESDLDFVRRLLAEEGLSWRYEDTEEGPGMVLFADSTMPDAVPEDPVSAAEGGIRYHRAGAVERQDTVQALMASRFLQASLTSVLSYDYKAGQVVLASSPSRVPGSPRLPSLESHDVPGQEAYANRRQAEHYADLHMEGVEARSQQWRGRSTVRTLRAGTTMTVTGVPRHGRDGAPALTVVRVVSVGVNNLPPPARHALAELFGPIPALLQELTEDGPDDLALVVGQAVKSGYANCFEAIPAEFPWRPRPPGSDGRTNAKPTAFGAQSAIVVGPDGSDEARGADELYCDRLGRVRIRFHWQENARASCWVRVAQRLAGGGMGSQFLPRIGQEVLVQFIDNDIDRPLVVGALYNGQGEGGIPPTPGGRARADSTESYYALADDHRRSAQGNLAGGNSPVWHGASSAVTGHRNSAAQWGVRSKEFGGTGYNQLLFDDTDAQGRIQLRCTCAATELNLGHLIHGVDNYRGSFRGLGAELRTDAGGVVRAGAGVLVSSYAIDHEAGARDAVGENAAGIGLLRQAVRLAGSFNAAAVTHRTVALSTLAEAAPDAARVSLAARDGFALHAGQSAQMANGDAIHLMSGQDTQFVTGGHMRMHARQALGVLAGATKPGQDAVGLQAIAAQGDVDIQAQAGEVEVQARDDVDVISANAHIDWAAAKRISLSTAGGANITIEGGNITVQCPGKITVHAGKKTFNGPGRLGFDMPALPRSICVECLRKALLAGPAFTMVE